MSKYLVLGIENSVGEFTPVGSEKTYNYNNVVLNCINYETPANNGGYKVSVLKIKKPIFDKVLETSKLTRQDLIYSIVDIYYNQYTYLEKIYVIAKMDVKIMEKK